MHPLYKFSGHVVTDVSGIQQLANFNIYCNKFQNCLIKIDLSDADFFEANLSSILLSLVRKLSLENNLRFSLNHKIKNGTELCALKRNGLINLIHNLEDEVVDNRKSVIPVRFFTIDDADKFADYIEWDLFTHRGLQGISKDQASKLKNSYFEIFDNVGIHANTSYPVVSCGQLYPNQKELKFTLVDMGDGFLKRIAFHTASTNNPIIDAKTAIEWAIKGGSTKTDTQGGTGLKKILKYCIDNNGEIHIYTDGCYWSYNKSVTSNYVKNGFCGTSISLIFKNL